MFVGGRLRNYCAAAGGDQLGKRVPEVRQGLGPRPGPRPACGRPVPAPLLANLKKTQSCGTSLHLPLTRALEAAPQGRRARKSRSVGDISHYARHVTKCRRSGVQHPMERVEPLEGGLEAAGAAGAAVGVGALRACLLLMLNAWRVRRAEARALRGRVDQMRLQVATLRALNKAEAERASFAAQDAGKSRTHADQVRQQLDSLRVDHEALTGTAASLETRLLEQVTVAENLRNELLAARQEAAALDSQLAKERAKLASTREERNRLQEQAIEREKQLQAVEMLLEEAHLQNERASVSMQVSTEEMEQLSARYRALEAALECERAANRKAQHALDEQVLELERVRALLDVERSPRRSVSRVLEVLRVPLGLLQAFYLAVCPYPSSRAL